MSRVDFSPTFIWVTPSSQPGPCVSCATLSGAGEGVRLWARGCTFDELTNANLDDEVPTADGRVEPTEVRERSASGTSRTLWKIN